MARLRLIFDDSDTIEVYKYALPSSKTETQRLRVPARQESEYVELFLDDGNTGDTVDWGFRGAVLYGTVNPRDIDP
jgi:hypothetical protein